MVQVIQHETREYTVEISLTVSSQLVAILMTAALNVNRMEAIRIFRQVHPFVKLSDAIKIVDRILKEEGDRK